MKEIEVLVEVFDDIDKIKNVLNKFNYVGLKETLDEYYYDPKRNDLKPDENGELSHCLRLRIKNNEYSITYKDDIFENGKWLYSNEYETNVSDIKMIREILNKLGLVKFIEIDNKKETYIYDKYEIVLEIVKDLGIFMEVEYCTNEDVDINKEKVNIQEFIKSLGLNVSNELGMGKPEMFLRKHNIIIK